MKYLRAGLTIYIMIVGLALLGAITLQAARQADRTTQEASAITIADQEQEKQQTPIYT